MKWVPIISIEIVVCMSMLAIADVPNAATEPASSQQLQRNRILIRDLVLGGLQLAAEDDPLSRADFCHSLAERVVDEIRVSASDRELDRAAQLSEHLHVILKLGVAGNLRIVRFESSPSSAREIDVQRVGGQIREFMEPLEQFLLRQSTGDFKLRCALRNVRDGQAEVEKVLQGAH